jgi:RNA polymerase sigma-70 factor (ECF subfamily)
MNLAVRQPDMRAKPSTENFVSQTAGYVTLYYRTAVQGNSRGRSSVADTQSSMQSDSQLVSAVLEGDEAAFAALVDRYQRTARAVAYHRIGDHHAAEDAAQEAFVAAFRKLPTLRDGSLFGPWLLAIVRHQAERIGKRGTRAAGRQPGVPLDHAADVAAPEESRLDDDNEFLLAALMGLPERERRLLMLRHFGGHSVAEIAQMLGRPVGTVTKQLSRGYARLRERFAEVNT